MNREDTKDLIEVMQAYVDGKSIEASYKEGKAWNRAANPSWQWGAYNYRIALTKPSIDWDQVSKEYNWLSTDKNYRSYLSSNKPEIIAVNWNVKGNIPMTKAEVFSSFKSGDCNWKDSLVMRPGYVGD